MLKRFMSRLVSPATFAMLGAIYMVGSVVVWVVTKGAVGNPIVFPIFIVLDLLGSTLLFIAFCLWLVRLFRGSSEIAVWFRGLSALSKATLFAAIAFIALLAPFAYQATIQELQRGKIASSSGISKTCVSPTECRQVVQVVTTASVLHPGDSTTFTVAIDIPWHILNPRIDCYLLAPDVQSVLITWEVQDGQPICSWAIAPKHLGSQIIGFDVWINTAAFHRGFHVTGYRQLIVSEFPLSLPNLSTAIGVASGALTLYLLATGKKLEGAGDKAGVPMDPKDSRKLLEDLEGAPLRDDTQTDGNDGISH